MFRFFRTPLGRKSGNKGLTLDEMTARNRATTAKNVAMKESLPRPKASKPSVNGLDEAK